MSTAVPEGQPVNGDRKPFRVLTLDGGGVRGLYTASLLHQLCLRLGPPGGATQVSRDLGAQFDLIVGTSTGSIVAIALAAGVSLQEVIDLYKESDRNQIFQNPQPLQRPGWLSRVNRGVWAVLNLFSAANDPAPLRNALAKVLADETVRQLYERRKIALCVPAIDAFTQQGWVFKTPHLPRLSRDDNTKLVDVCMASSAAPIYFPLHGIQGAQPGSSTTKWFVDGGLWANNPILVALAEAVEIAGADRPIEILSVGTGGAAKSNIVNAGNANRGIGAWTGGIDIVSMSLDSQANTTSYLAASIAKAMPKVLLHRLADAPVTPEEAGYLGLDTGSAKAIDLILKRADRAVDINVSDLTREPLSPARRAVRDIFGTTKASGALE